MIDLRILDILLWICRHDGQKIIPIISKPRINICILDISVRHEEKRCPALDAAYKPRQITRGPSRW